MSRQLDIQAETREQRKRDALVAALTFGLPGSLEHQGITLLGFTIKYDAWDCLMTIRADIGGTRSVCFVGSDTIINCILKADSGAKNNTLRWREDRYHKKET